MLRSLILVGAAALAFGPAEAGAQQTPASPAAAPSSAPGTAPASAAAAVKVVQQVCLPLLRGGAVKSVAEQAGLQRRDGEWILPIEGKRQVTLDLPGGTNPHVCSATILHAPGAGEAIAAALGSWARTQSPPLAPIKVDQASTGPSYRRMTSSWAGQGPGGSEAVVLAREKTLNGAPVHGDLGEATLLVSLTPS